MKACLSKVLAFGNIGKLADVFKNISLLSSAAIKLWRVRRQYESYF
jgi:hypothetical protein